MVISLVGGLIVGLGFILRAPYSQQSRRCVADNQSDSFQDISDPEKDNLRLGFSILLVNYLSTAYN